MLGRGDELLRLNGVKAWWEVNTVLLIGSFALPIRFQFSVVNLGPRNKL